jgi:hypothetical protein
MTKAADDSWHFAQPALAKKSIDTFEVGLISAQALFAPRPMGKSEFLEKDNGNSKTNHRYWENLRVD